MNSCSGMGKLKIDTLSKIYLFSLQDLHIKVDLVCPPNSSSIKLGFSLISSFILSSSKFRNYCASCWSYPLKTYKWTSIAFFKELGDAFWLFKSFWPILLMAESRCWWSLNSVFYKYLSRTGVAIRLWIIVFMKQVFPKLANPLKRCVSDSRVSIMLSVRKVYSLMDKFYLYTSPSYLKL